MPQQQGPGPRPGWGPSPAQIRSGPLTGNLGAFASNAAAPQLVDFGLAAGFALIFTPLLPQGQVGPSEYQYGTHATQTYNAETLKSAVFPSVPTPPAAASPNPLRTIIAGPQQIDLTISGWAIGGALAPQGPVPPFQYASQDNPSQIGGQVFKAAFQTQATSGILGAFIETVPQFEDRPTRQVWPSVPTPIVSVIIKQVFGAPQQIDLTQQAWLVKPSFPQGPVPPLTVGQQQSDPTQLAALVWTAQPSTPVIAGVTVAPTPTVPPQFDPSANPTQVWTPSTFSPSAPPAQPFTVTPGKLPPWPWTWTHDSGKTASQEDYSKAIERAMLLEQRLRAERRRLEQELRAKAAQKPNPKASAPERAQQISLQNRDYAILRRKIKAAEAEHAAAVTREIELRLKALENEQTVSETVAARRKRELMMVLLLA